jgi:hypothetical protein
MFYVSLVSVFSLTRTQKGPIMWEIMYKLSVNAFCWTR